MKEADLVSECVLEMKKAVSLPITVKCRLGVNKWYLIIKGGWFWFLWICEKICWYCYLKRISKTFYNSR